MQLKKIFVIAIAFILLFIITGKASFASILSLTPAKANMTSGTIVPVQIRLNTQDEEINAVSAYLSYSQEKLEVVSIDTGSDFPIEAENSYDGGLIKISRGSINPVAGSITVATINFKPKNQGKAYVSFTEGSAVPRASDSTDSLNLNASSGGEYNISKGSAIKTAATNVKLQITALTLTEITTKSIVLSWSTNEKTDTSVEYGLEKSKYFLKASDPALVLNHKLLLNDVSLIPGTKYYFRIRAKNDQDEVFSSEVYSFQLKGYQVKVKILDKNNKPLKNKKVTLYSNPIRSETNASGEAVFEDVAPGRHRLVIDFGLFNKTREINVKDDLNKQNFDLTIYLSPLQEKIYGIKPLYLIIFAAILFGLAFTLIMIHKDRCIAYCHRVVRRVRAS